MTTYNLVTNFGAAVAPADSSPALASWLSTAADGDTLIIPGDTGQSYHWASTNGPTNGLKNATIIGTGASVDHLFIGNAGLLRQDYTHSARIQTANKGATSVTITGAGNTLLGPADVSLFSVGQYILIAGLGTQVPDSYPPNFQFYEYRKITAIVGSTLFFTDPLKNDYKSTWPYIDAFDVTINIGTSTFTCLQSPLVLNRPSFLTTSGTLPTPLSAAVATYYAVNVSGQTFQLATAPNGSPMSLSGTQTGTHSYHGSNFDLAGPATIYAMAPEFDGVQTYIGLRCTEPSNGLNCSAGRSLTIDGMYFDGGGPSFSVGISALIKNSQIGSQNEIDKCLEQLTYQNCTAIGIKQVFCQSATGSLVINGTTLTALNGTPRFSALNNSTISILNAGTLYFGATEAIHNQNSTITTVNQSGTQLNLSAFPHTFSGGVFTVSNLNCNAGPIWGQLIPGYKYFYAVYDGVIHNIDNLGNMVTFKVLDVTQDATNTYFHTDLVAEPVTTFVGQPANRIICFSALETSGSAALTAIQAPSPLPTSRSISAVFG